MDNATKEALLSSRIQTRLDVLVGWVKDGAPENYEVPTSLTQVRKWSDPQLGIESIGSPGSFTTNHKKHGKAVRQIQKCLSKINKPKKKKTPSTKRIYELRMENSSLKKALTSEANRYTVMEELYSNKCVESNLVKNKIGFIETELSEALAEIDKLKKERGKRVKRKKHLTLVDGGSNGE